jgi:hypothetical protein
MNVTVSRVGAERECTFLVHTGTTVRKLAVNARRNFFPTGSPGHRAYLVADGMKLEEAVAGRLLTLADFSVRTGDKLMIVGAE